MNGFPLFEKIKIFGPIIFIIFLVLAGLTFLFISFLKYIHEDISKVVILNFYNDEIIVSFNGEEKALDIMEIYTTEYRGVSNSNLITITDTAGNLIKAVGAIELSETQGLIIEPIHRNINFCYFKANVTDFYYYEGDESSDIPNLDELQLIRKANREENNSIFIIDEYFMYPGHADGKNLPKILTENQKIYGIYPIPCGDITSLDRIKQTVIDYKEYNEQESREYVVNKINEINELNLSDVEI